MRCALVIALLAAMTPAAAHAQVRGRVTDATGRPLPGVLVELWDAYRRLGGDGTDAQGYFRIAPPAGAAAAGPRVLLARGVGLDPLRRPLGRSDSQATLVMEPRAIEVEAATVTAEASTCPAVDDSLARALWERAARRYDVQVSALGVSSDTRLFAAMLPASQLGLIDTTRLVETFVLGAATPEAFASRFLTQRYFYAVPSSGVRWRRFGRWHYPLLESTRAWHFADSLFGVMNRLALVPTAAGDTVVAFCSRLGSRPYVVGRLWLAADTTLASAEWMFETPGRREEAGGRVLFAPIGTSSTAQPLLPVAGLFWRRLSGGTVYQEWMEYRQWLRCEAPGDCRRTVPLR